MLEKELFTRRGEFLQTLYSKNSQYFSLFTDCTNSALASCLENDSPCIAISFVEYKEVGAYRGEDSGAIYPEYSSPVPHVTYELHKNDLIQEYYGTKVTDLVKELYLDGANWIPLDRHFKLVSYLLEHDDSIVYLKESLNPVFMTQSKGIIAYAPMNFVLKPEKRTDPPVSLYITLSDSIIAECHLTRVQKIIEKKREGIHPDWLHLAVSLSPQIHDFDFLKKIEISRHPEIFRNYPVYYNLPLIRILQNNRHLFKSVNSFDGFCLL